MQLYAKPLQSFGIAPESFISFYIRYIPVLKGFTAASRHSLVYLGPLEEIQSGCSRNFNIRWMVIFLYEEGNAYSISCYMDI